MNSKYDAVEILKIVLDVDETGQVRMSKTVPNRKGRKSGIVTNVNGNEVRCLVDGETEVFDIREFPDCGRGIGVGMEFLIVSYKELSAGGQVRRYSEIVTL